MPSLSMLPIALVAVVASLSFAWAPLALAQATPPPYGLAAPGTALQSVEINPSAKQDDGSHDIEIFPVEGSGAVARAQPGVLARHGHLVMIPGSTAYVILPSGGGDFASAPLPNDSGTRSFVVFEDPATVPGPLSPYFQTGQHIFDAQCSTFTCGFLDGGLESEAESNYNMIAGSVVAHVDDSTPAYGRRFYDSAPGGGRIYNHHVQSTATAGLQDWVWASGAGPNATIVVQATLGASLTSPQAPVNAADWTTPVYGDIRNVNPCTDVVMTSDELLRPVGERQTEIGVDLSIQSSFQQQGQTWVPGLSNGASLDVTRAATLAWVDEEGFPDCSDDVASVIVSSTGSLAPTLSVQLSVPTNQWSLVSVAAAAHAICRGPFACDLHANAPAQITVTSPNAALVAWNGIAGLTAVPEPAQALVPALLALGGLARSRVRRA